MSTPYQVPDDLIERGHRGGLDYDKAAGEFDWREYVAAVLAGVLPAHEATVRRELHFPTIAPMHSGEWGVHCFACSQAAEDYVPRCLVRDLSDWPPLVLAEAPPSTLMDAKAEAAEKAGIPVRRYTTT